METNKQGKPLTQDVMDEIQATILRLGKPIDEDFINKLRDARHKYMVDHGLTETDMGNGDEFNAGWQAARDGLPPSANPYRTGTHDNVEWDKGWIIRMSYGVG